MLKEILEVGFTETPGVLEEIHVHKAGHAQAGSVSLRYNINSAVSEDSTVLLMRLDLQCYANHESEQIFTAEITTKTAFTFKAPIDKNIVNDEEAVTYFGTPLYQRTAEMLTSIFRAMGCPIQLPLVARPVVVKN